MKYIDQQGKMCTFEDAECFGPESRLKRLEDINSIKEIIYHWCMGCDTLDQQLMASCLTEDACLSWGDIDPTIYRGKKNILDMLMQIVGGPEGGLTQTHYVTNQQIWLQSRDSAIIYSAMHSWQIYKVETKEPLICYGRFEMRAVRDTDGEWRFNSLKFIIAGQFGGNRECEQFDRPWPPIPVE